MSRIASGLLAAMCWLAASGTMADEARLDFGGDQYVAGQASRITTEVARDAFAAGYDVSVAAPVTGDAHLAGYSVTVTAPVTGDLYAAGATLDLGSTVAGDFTAFGQTIRQSAAAGIGGNARLAGATITLGGPVAGSLIATAQSLTIDGTIAGDLSFYGETLSFGPNAKVTGRLLLSAPKPIDVPASVAPADRVSFTQLVVPDYTAEAGKTAEHVVKSVWPAIWATGLWWLLLIVAGLVFLALGSRFVGKLEAAAATRPLRGFGLGILGFATLLGLVPVFALTVVGLAVMPFLLLFVAVVWALGYLGGAYLVTLRLASAMLPVDTLLKRFGVVVAGVVVAGLLGMIPMLGWLLMLALTAFGLGAFGRMMLGRGSAETALPAPGTDTLAPERTPA